MKNLKSKILSIFISILIILSVMPFSALAAPASDIPAEMLDNAFLDALAYTGYNVQAQKNDGSIFMLGDSKAKIIDVSAHTQGHILWYFPQDKALFTGDTLFNLCIGGLFEGNAEQMFAALQKIKELPDDVDFYPGHEYTINGADLAHYLNHGKPEFEQYLQNAISKLQRTML